MKTEEHFLVYTDSDSPPCWVDEFPSDDMRGYRLHNKDAKASITAGVSPIWILVPNDLTQEEANDLVRNHVMSPEKMGHN